MKRSSKVRLILLLVLIVSLYGVGKLTGVAEQLDAEEIRSMVRGAGVWGFAIYAGAFAGGEFIHIPGMVFVAAGILAYGKTLGFAATLVASVGAVCFSFLVVRSIGGRALSEIERPFVQRTLARLDEHPIRTVILLRLLLWLAPPLNYSLALSNIRFRDYLIGSFLGLIPPIGGATLFFEWLFG